MTLSFRPEAEREMLEAKAWYEARSPGLGLEFARAVEAALMNAARHPSLGRRAGKRCRRE
jgi:plasmid stabilization system protein ParE